MWHKRSQLDEKKRQVYELRSLQYRMVPWLGATEKCNQDGIPRVWTADLPDIVSYRRQLEEFCLASKLMLLFVSAAAATSRRGCLFKYNNKFVLEIRCEIVIMGNTEHPLQIVLELKTFIKTTQEGRKEGRNEQTDGSVHMMNIRLRDGRPGSRCLF
jgi:hypothetical protein